MCRSGLDVEGPLHSPSCNFTTSGRKSGHLRWGFTSILLRMLGVSGTQYELDVPLAYHWQIYTCVFEAQSGLLFRDPNPAIFGGDDGVQEDTQSREEMLQFL